MYSCAECNVVNFGSWEVMASVIKDLTGLQCGVLRPFQCLGTIRGRAVWKCRCEPSLGGCGAIAIVKATNLVKSSKGEGGTKSCGCLVKSAARKQAAALRAAQ